MSYSVQLVQCWSLGTTVLLERFRVCLLTFDKILRVAGVASRDLWDEVHAMCNIQGRLGAFDADVLLDSGSTMELRLSKYKANQLGLAVTGERETSTISYGTQMAVYRRWGSHSPSMRSSGLCTSKAYACWALNIRV